MTTSDQINELAAALAKAQGQIEGATKATANTYFKSKYADLSSVWDACRKPLSDNGLSVVQAPSADGAKVTITTRLLHSSGQWIEGVVTTEAKDATPQSVGSAVTYLRRYALQSFVGVAPEDDDAEAAQGRGNGKAAVPVAADKPKGYDDWLVDMQAVADEGPEKFSAAWKTSKADYRAYLTKQDVPAYDALRKRVERKGVAA